jgi:sortase B
MRKKDFILGFILAIVLMVCVIGAFFLVRYMHAETGSGDPVQQPVETTEASEGPGPESEEPVIDLIETEDEGDWYVPVSEETDVLEAEETEEYPGVEIPDLASYQSVNEDVDAYLKVPDTKIDYPILQHAEDDDYYLNHNYDGTTRPGSVYSESVNSKDFTDPMTILYAHNMTSGVLFHDLEKFQDQTFFNEHPDFFVYLNDRVLVYRVFAAYMYSDHHLMYWFHNLERRSIRERYAKEIFLHNNYRDHYRMTEARKLTEDTHILTLSTCVNELSENRYLIQAYPRYVIYYRQNGLQGAQSE